MTTAVGSASHAPRRGRSSRPDELSVRFIDRDADLEDLVDEVGDAIDYAIDTEFHRERTYFAQLALVQLAWNGGVAAIDPLAVDLVPLKKILRGQGTAVIHAADQDLEVLERSTGAVPARMFDTQLAARFLGMSSPSLVSLADKMLGIRLEKGDQLADWTRRPLRREQIQYAAHDVAHLIELKAAISDELSRRGRLEWAEEECAVLLERARALPLPEQAWWRLRQARQFRGSARGVAQSVAAWRERRAQTIDRPVRYVLSDLAVAAIAHRPPHSRTDLEHVRNLDLRSLSQGIVAELLGAVAEGESLSGSAIAVPPGPDGAGVAKPAVALALAYAGELARTLDIDASLLATRADVIDFLQVPPTGRLTETWRHHLVGEPLARLAAGNAALALQGGDLVIEERSFRPISS
ncbi:MAG: HRDC domain-containing protein [Acidimicrobiales bacterium]